MKVRLNFRKELKVDIRYRTKTDVTERTIQASEAFGLGVEDEREFKIVDNVDIEVKQGDMVYITGDSGSGKSSILRAFAKHYGDEAIDINKLDIDETKPLVDTLGKTPEEAFALLSRVGLGDAFLFIRRYPHLSDGQKYRYRLAKLLESGKKVWIADEFCSTLDRDTAKIVSYNVQKFARKAGITIIVATCNMDLDTDLNPSVRVDKRYGSEIHITYQKNKPAEECSLVQEMELVAGNYEDWKELSVFHYRSHRAPPSRAIFVLKRNPYVDYAPAGTKGRDYVTKGELCGVIVYSYPPIVTFGRRQAFGRVVKQPELNEKISIISRVVVHPKYRSIGLGQKLVRETLPLCPTEYAETIAVMAKYNPFFEKAGMQKVMAKEPSTTLTKAVEALERLGFDSRYIASERYNLKMLAHVDLNTVREIFAKYYHPRYGKQIPYLKKTSTGLAVKSEFGKYVRKFSAEELSRLIRILAVMAQVSIYLIWSKSGPVEIVKDEKAPKAGKHKCPACGSDMRKIRKTWYCTKVNCNETSI